MARRRRQSRMLRWAATSVVAMSLACGCASHNPFDRDDSEWKSIPSSDANGDLRSGKQSGSPAGDMPAPTSSMQLPTSQKPGVTASMMKTAGAVKEALTIKPKVIEAEDPISLDASPKPVSPDVHLKAAQLFESQGLTDRAEDQFRRVLESDPKSLPAMTGLARLYDRQGRFNDAVAVYRRAATAHPDQPMVYNDMGLCLARNKDLTAAHEALAKAVRLDPKEKLYRNNIATLLVEMNRPDDALMQLMEVHPPAEAHYNVGYLLHRRGQQDAAREHFVEALSADPQLEPARKMLAKLDAKTLASAAPPAAAPAPVKTHAAFVPGAQANPFVAQASAPESNSEPPESPRRIPSVVEARMASLRIPSSSTSPRESSQEVAPLPGSDPSLLPAVQ